MKKVVCSFANKAVSGGFPRLRKQAQDMRLFDEVYLYTEADLDKDFKKRFRKYLIPYNRGYGFWCWKPQIILQTLRKMDDGDLLVYMDAGSHLNAVGRDRMLEYFDAVNESDTGILAFRSPEHLDRKLTKMDVFNYFGVADDTYYTDTTQIEGGHLIIKKKKESVDFIKEWIKVFEDDFSLINDDASKSKNFEDFRDHRHDQSIFSILGKKYEVVTFSTDETYSLDWKTLSEYPFHARRDMVYKYKFCFKYKNKIARVYRVLWRVLYKMRYV